MVSSFNLRTEIKVNSRRNNSTIDLLDLIDLYIYEEHSETIEISEMKTESC